MSFSDIEILHLERDLIICVKPQGVSSESDPSGDGMPELLSAKLRELGENCDIFPVHRLDRAVGGVMIYARTREGAAELSRLISSREGFEKIYLAAVAGVPDTSCGEMRDFIFRDAMQRKAFIVGSERRGAKLGILDYEVLCVGDLHGQEVSVLRVRLQTGRFHQIRVQLASRGMPIVGDGKYGSRIKAEGIALWAAELRLRYRGRELAFGCEPRGDWARELLK